MSTRIEWLKESMIAVLAIVTLTALLMTYHRLTHMPASTSDTEAKQMANVEKVGTALFGIFAAFVGYYGGRVPAEHTAAVAQQNAETQKALADQKSTDVRHAKALLAEARPIVSPASAHSEAVTDHSALAARIDEFLQHGGDVS
jgi:hypothetical protein